MQRIIIMMFVVLAASTLVIACSGDPSASSGQADDDKAPELTCEVFCDMYIDCEMAYYGEGGREACLNSCANNEYEKIDFVIYCFDRYYDNCEAYENCLNENN